MEVEDVRKWLEDLLRNLMGYDTHVLYEARLHLVGVVADLYTHHIPLAIKYKDMTLLKAHYELLFASYLFDQAYTYKTLKKEIPKDVIGLLVEYFTSVYSPKEYQDKMIKVGNEIENALKEAIEYIAWKKQFKG